MAPPSARPRLADIDAVALGAEVDRAVLDHLSGLGIALGLHWRVTATCAVTPTRTDLGRAAELLCHHAQTGMRLDAPVHEYLVTLVPLWCAPLGQAPDDVAGEADPDTALGTVILAALARDDIAQGYDVDVRRLAALASLSATQIRKLIRDGEIGATMGDVPAVEARRWLGGRGVTGL